MDLVTLAAAKSYTNKRIDEGEIVTGATPQQAAQIEQNKINIAGLQTEIENKQPKGNYVKTVNGNKPDASGNVVVTTGGNSEAGFSPIATVKQINSGAVISITDKNGTTTATIVNGIDGKDGADGADGGHYTPIVTQPTSDTMRISFTPSESDMPAVNPVTVNLPISEDSGENVDLTGYAKETWVREGFQPKGNYLTKVPDGYAKTEDIPTEPEDIGAQPKGNYASPDDIPKVPNWAMQASKPAYTASEVGADPTGTAASAVSAHNANNEAHPDIRLEIKAIREQLAAFLDVDEETLNELSELIARIVANQTSIEQLTTGKVNVSDIVNNLTTNVANKPLSAAQGVVIKDLIDGLSSGKLDASKLSEAINTALAQAKANGEFDGAKGDPGRGIKSIARTSGNGAAGTTDTYTITYTDNTTGTFQVRNGSNGYTPVRGVDYWTLTDKAEIEAYIDGKLSEEDSGTQEIFEDVLADVGYQEMYRINSSGVFKAWDGDTPADLTGYIPVAPGDVIRMENITIPSVFVSGTYYQNVGVYTSTKTFIKKVNLVVDDAGIWQSMDMKIEDGNVTGFTVAPAVFGENVAFIAINAYDINANSKIYVNSTIISGGGDVPDYWLAEMATKAGAIQTAMETAGRNKSAFLWYTDAHWETNTKVSPKLLRYLIRNTPMNKVNFGGDIINDPAAFTHANIRYAYEWRKAVADLPNHHSVPGNHDLNHNSTDVRNMAYAFLIAPEESSDMVFGEGMYYYIDGPCERTRYLHLDYLTSDHAAMTAQGEFIVDALKSTPEGWHIIAIAHRWFQYTSGAAPTVGSVPNYEKEILTIFDEYNARSSHTASNYFDAQSFADGKGKVEFCIGGHIHVDYDFASDGGIPVIITASDTNQDRSPDEIEDSGTAGTTTESAVYGIIADYGNGKITVVGVGRGGSRVIALG